MWLWLTIDTNFKSINLFIYLNFNNVFFLLCLDWKGYSRKLGYQTDSLKRLKTAACIEMIPLSSLSLRMKFFELELNTFSILLFQDWLNRILSSHLESMTEIVIIFKVPPHLGISRLIIDCVVKTKILIFVWLDLPMSDEK